MNREYLNYPKNWAYKRYKTKHLDSYACYACGVREADGALLHSHHIVFRSRSGTNSYRNLVTLCFHHHQQQHDHEINASGGEPAGLVDDQSIEELDSLWATPNDTVLPPDFDELAYVAARPTFEAGLAAFRSNGKSARELFGFLIQTFGRNVARYALKFAEEERLRGRWMGR